MTKDQKNLPSATKYKAFITPLGQSGSFSKARFASRAIMGKSKLDTLEVARHAKELSHHPGPGSYYNYS